MKINAKARPRLAAFVAGALMLGTASVSASIPALADDNCSDVAQTTVQTANKIMVISTDRSGVVTIVQIDKVTEAARICTADGKCTPLPQ